MGDGPVSIEIVGIKCICTSCHQKEIAFQALQRIASDHEITASGNRKRISRVTAINIARTVCEQLGLDYSGKARRE